MTGVFRINKLVQGFIVAALSLFIFSVITACSDGGRKAPKTETAKSESSSSAYKFEKDGELTFLTKSGNFITSIDIEIADTEQKRMQGLMFREHMDENRGMLFIFPREDYQAFWMKNTVIPLDMIFVNSKKEIINIHKNTTPFSEQTYPSTAPAIYVIEVNAGFTDKYNIQPGDKIVWRVLR